MIFFYIFIFILYHYSSISMRRLKQIRCQPLTTRYLMSEYEKSKDQRVLSINYGAVVLS